MDIKPINDPEVVTGHLRLLEMYRRYRKEVGPGNTSLKDLQDEADIAIRLLEAQHRMCLYIIGEEVRKSNERR